MTVDLTDLLRDRLASMDNRLARIESKLMQEDEITPQDLLSRLQSGCVRTEKIETRMEHVERLQGRIVGALVLVSAIIMPSVSLFAPILRRMMHLE